MKAQSFLGSLVLSISLSVVFPIAAQAGGAGPGGGDRCEDRFKAVALDLSNWIQQGGHRQLNLRAGTEIVEADEYARRMRLEIGRARITCIGPTDAGYPLTVNGRAKECVNEVDRQGIRRITCDRAKFYTSSANPENDPAQYRMVHHEYASLAGLESPTQDDSQYGLSSQITDFLENQMVKRLAVKKPANRVTDRLVKQIPQSNVKLSVAEDIVIPAGDKYKAVGSATSSYEYCTLYVGYMTDDWVMQAGVYDIVVDEKFVSMDSRDESHDSGLARVTFRFKNDSSDARYNIICWAKKREVPKYGRGVWDRMTGGANTAPVDGFDRLDQMNKSLSGGGLEILVP